MNRIIFVLFLFLVVVSGNAQIPVNTTAFNNESGARIIKAQDKLSLFQPVKFYCPLLR